MLFSACDNSGTGQGTTSGGATSGGTTTTQSGGAASGGSTQVPVTGGAASTGGLTVQGGAPSTGGATSTGGASSSGGVARTGGAASTGGMTGAGGLPGAGGAPRTGGAMITGGAGAGGTGGSSTRTGGTNGAGGTSGGTVGAGGMSSASGGTTATGGRNPALIAMVKAMAPGWNLGNSFDGTPNVTSWGNPAPNQTLINAVKAAGFNSMRIPVSWTTHIGAAPNYTIDAAWMASVVQTAQWAVDAGLYAFVNTHHEADGSGWVSFPADPAPVVAEVTAVWTQIATAFKAFDSHLMLECFNEPNEAGGGGTAQAMADLNQYLVACVNAIRSTGGANATRVIMIQGVGASPSQTGINSVLKISVINDPNLIFSVHTYYPTNFGLSTTPYAWGSASDYTSMSNSITQILGWLPGWAVVVGEWGSQNAQALANRVVHAQAYARDTSTAGICPMWWDNGGSFAIFNRSTGAQTFPTIVNALVTGAQKGLATPNTYATLANP
jgi:endoglucanase